MTLKDGLFWAFGIGAGLKDRAVILMYHSIEDRPGHFNSVAPDNFEKQMQYLASHSYAVISLSELVERLLQKRSIERCVVITFDDGFRNNYSNVFPILKKYKFPATIFVTTGWISGRDDKSGLEYLREDELREVETSGLIDIEPHTVSHPKLAELSLERAREEIAGSKQHIEELLGKKCRFFAYPYGNYDEATARVVSECGFEAAVTVREGTVPANSRLFELPRNSIDGSTTFTQFRGKVSNAVDRYEAMKKLFGI